MGANNTFNPDDYGGDVQAAVAAAKLAGGTVILSAGVTYTVSSPVLIDWYGGGIETAGSGKATLQSSANNTAVIELLGGTGYNEHNFVRNLIIKRTVTAIAGGHGIKQVNKPGGNDYLARAHIHDCAIYGQDVGIYLGGTDFSTIGNLYIEGSKSHGIEIYGGSIVALQWYWEGQTIIQGNAGSGLYMHTNPALSYPSGLPTGNIQNVHTYANGGYGMCFQGSASCPLQAVRMTNCFLGDDGHDDVFLDTFGSGHVLVNVYTELSKARGIYFTVNNSSYRMLGCAAFSHQRMGIASCGNDALISNCAAGNNGRSGLNPWGLYLEGLRSTVTGGHYGNPAAGVGYAQDWGIVGASGSGRISENNLFGNNAGGFTGPASFSLGYNTP